MYFVPKDVPLSSRSTTTTTIEEIEEEMETTEEATFWGTNPSKGLEQNPAEVDRYF